VFAVGAEGEAKVRFVVRSPPPWSGYVVLMVVEFEAGVKPKSEEEAT
jgi:hypothetical protein